MVATMMANIDFCLILLTPLLVIISMFVSYSQSTVLRLKRCEAMSFDLLDITWTTWCCRWALGMRNIEASKMHHDESWWQRSPKNLEPVLRQAGGANLWGWGGPGANIQVALQQHYLKIPQTRMLNYQTINLFFLNFLFTNWMIKFAVKNSKTGWHCFLVFRWNWMVKVLPLALWTTRAGLSHHVHLHHHLVQRCLCQECRPSLVARLCICLTLPTIRWLVNLHLDSGGPYNLTVYHRWLVNLEI